MKKLMLAVFALTLASAGAADAAIVVKLGTGPHYRHHHHRVCYWHHHHRVCHWR